ncbi:MAG: serine/threonine protein kinase [Sandaracinus sp.]|nr:serine/threonine protein kinase [Sandaracinus sp.]MCB9619882.1 serine/threonine protein kinase [Sandaracinus sp.]MCB9625268.1 serine/threonine protein kinase [Sandaracinus sp.]
MLDDLVIGARVADRYEVVGRLGDGGMARLYEALDLRARSRRVVLKLPLLEHPELFDRLEREAAILAPLRSAHVVRALDFVRTDDGVPCLVLAYVPGGDLAARLDRGEHPSSRRTLRILRAVASALDHLHAHGIVHRDVKPANVVGYDGRAVLVDFGLATSCREELRAERTRILGTPMYMAPEQALGLGEHVGPASDRYGLASLAFELVTGARPYPNGRPGPILRAIAERGPRRPSDVGCRSIALDAVFARAFARDPDRRHESATAFVEALRLALTERGSLSLPRPSIGSLPTVVLRAA